MSKVPPVECHSCGYPIGEVYEAVTELKNAAREKAGVTQLNPFINPPNIDLSELFEALHLNLCCRIKVNTCILPQDMVINN